MRNIIIWLAVMVFSAGVHEATGADAGITRTRVAVFSEPGFPSRSPRSAEWYKRTLEEAGLKVKLVGLQDLRDPKRFSRECFDTLILATGGSFPRDGEEAIGLFMRGGGAIVVDESIAGWQEPPEEVMKEACRLREDYLKGVNIEQYLDFVYQQGAMAGNIFWYSPNVKRWIPEITFFCNSMRPVGSHPGGSYSEEFEFELWPNPWGGANPFGPSYRRPFSEDLVQNEELAKAGLLNGFPETAPVMIALDSGVIAAGTQTNAEGKVMLKASNAREAGCARLAFFGTTGGMAQPASEYANDVLLPVYMFKAPSGYKYPRFEKQGVDKKDCESDFYIYRCHSRLKDGYTLVHMGVVGAHLLKSAQGKAILLGALRLAEAALPGERSRQYVKHCHELEERLSDFYGKAIKLMAVLEKAARVEHYEGNEKARDAAMELLQEQRIQFESISDIGERLRFSKLEKGEQGDAERMELLKRCNQAIKDLEKLDRQYGDRMARYQVAPSTVELKSQFKRISARFDFTRPSGITRLKGLYPLVKELGFDAMPAYLNVSGGFYQRDLLKEFGMPTGFRMCMLCMGELDKGVFNPDTGAVSANRFEWLEADEDIWKRYEKDQGWILNKLNARGDVKWVMTLEERNLQWSMWGQRTEKLFREYAQRLHGNIETLNRRWGTRYGGFEEIKLPLKRPESQADHALWEDWTRYREVYVLEDETKRCHDLIKKYAPQMYLQGYGSYCGQERFPASGINYYEYGKALDLNTLEMGSSEPLRDEVMTSDIAGFFKKNLTSEWGEFYSTKAPRVQSEKIDKLKERMWNGVGWGQIGWHTFMGSYAGWDYSNFIDADNNVMPLGWAMKELNRDFGVIGPIILDGEREEPPVRIVYSPTTHRHTCWPGVEANKSFDAACGFYRAFQQSHIQARAMDEGAIMDGYLNPACKVLVLPEMTYLNDRVMTNVVNFLKGGGAGLMTADTGRYDQYGHRRDGLLALAGVAVKTVKSAVVDVEGRQYVCHKTGTTETVGLEPLFPGETDILLKYESGEAAVTATKVGKGVLVVSGIPFGREYYGEWRWKPATALKVLDTMLGPMELDREFECADRQIVVRPWRYAGKRYLVVTNPIRKEMEPTGAAGGEFPFKNVAQVSAFKLKIKGNWKVKDVVLGMQLPVKAEGGYTQMDGMIGNPGGLVYELQEVVGSMDKRGIEAIKESKTEQANPGDKVEVKSPAGEQKKQYPLPFNGQLFAEEGQVRIGDYLVRMDVESGGRWGGDLYLRVDNGTEKIRKVCKTGDTVVYPFIEKTVKVVCDDVSEVMPIGIRCRITEEQPVEINPACAVREEAFEGHKSVVLENGVIWVRLLPGLGGRVIEMGYRRDGVNQLYCDRKLVRQGKAGNVGGGFVNYGGIEENCHSIPGPFWNQAFEYEVETNTTEVVIVKIKRSKPLAWENGLVSLEKKYTLRKGESQVHVNARVYNEKNAKDVMRYRLRPLLAVGGDANPADVHVVPVKDGVKVTPFNVRNVVVNTNVGTWTAFVDREKRKAFLATFKAQDMEEVYVYMGDISYNLEIMSVPKEVEPGQCMEIEYELGLMQGIRGLAGVGGEVGVNLNLSGTGRYGRNEKVQIEVEEAAFKENEAHVKVSVMKGETRVAEIGEAGMKVSAGRPMVKSWDWATGSIEDGDYQVLAEVADRNGNVLVKAGRPLVIAEAQRVSMAGQIEQIRIRLEAMRKEYAASKNKDLRERIVRVALLSDDLEAAASRGDSEKAGEIKKSIEALVQ